jgi:hypothetical protein
MGIRRTAATVVVTTLLAGCTGGADDATSTEDLTTTTAAIADEPPPAAEPEPTAPGPEREDSGPDDPALSMASPELLSAIDDVLAGSDQACDALDARHCSLPWPSDAHTRPDTDSATGLRVALPTAGAPHNADGVPMDLAEWNRNDGFSPNTRLMTYVHDLDAEASSLPSWTDLGASLAPDATVVIVDTDTGERIPLWAEPDLDVDDDGDRSLIIHPAVSLPNGHHFAVALRGLVTTAGTPVEPGPVFTAYRDRLATGLDAVEDRRDEMEEMFDHLATAGVGRDDLQLAWTFTTASVDDLTGRMLHIRDETLAELADAAPPFVIDDVDDDAGVDTIGRVVTGTFTVPNWLTGDGGPGNGFHYGDADLGAVPDALPVANGTLVATFRCNVADSVLDGDSPGRLVQYGHGLLGSEREINAGNVRDMSNEHDAVYCATKWAGMSEDDVGNAIDSLGDMSNFPTLVDRLQQGVLHHIALGRLMVADDGLASHPAFQRDDGTALIDTDRVVYDGNSQGGIMGLMLAAVSPDLERAVLGVPGMNYSLLLSRSVDFDPFRDIVVPAYPDPLERSLIISMVQMLWDRGEGAGYVRHIVSDALPGTPTTDVLLHVAFGDWQVTEISAFIAARTMGVPVHRPVTAPGRSGEVEPGWGLDAIPYPVDDIDYPWEGSGLIVWDSGSDPIPFGATPPRTSRDSHEDPRADANVRVQKAAFLFDGELIDVCGPDRACTAQPRD